MRTSEKIVYPILLLVILLGVYLDQTQREYFELTYVKEDGWIENMTALVIFAGGMLMFYRFLKLGKNRNGWFKLTTLGVALVFVFIAGEEISWGQRIFNTSSNEFFLENNVQDETNLHNLEVGGVKLNKLIFGQLLTVAMLTYLIIVPILYQRVNAFKKLCEKVSLPIPHVHQSVMFLLCLALVLIIGSGKKWELFELSVGLIFFFILWHPWNDIYKTE